MEPKWVAWAREIQATAQTGLTFSKDLYDRQRYERLQQLAATIMAECAGVEQQAVENLFEGQNGYATPKVDVRPAAFRDNKILLVQEPSDRGRWALPGGWADVNQSPRECIIAEVRDEAGLYVSPVKVAAVYDRARHPHRSPYAFHVYKIFFICKIIGGSPAPGLETDAVGFFDLQHLPELSVARVLEYQIARMFDHFNSPQLPTDFD
jgi:ADP-ribose pyrophosphatase YjhB (NUDIX family)